MLSSFWNEFLAKQNEFQARNPVVFPNLIKCTPLELTDKKFVLACDNSGVRMLLDKKKLELQSLLQEFTGNKLTLEIIVKEKKVKKEKELPLLTYEPSTEDMIVKSGLHAKYQFDNFAVSSSNQIAFAAAQAVAKNPGSSYNPLFLYGGVGVGKTHLAQAIGIEILKQSHEKKVYSCPGDQFTNELIESIREKSTQKFRRKYRHLNLIIIDDIQFIAGKQTVQEEFFHTFNSIVSAGGQVVLTSDRPPHEIKNLEDRLRSRFSGGLIVDIQEPDFELRSAIVLIKANEKNIEIDMEAARSIAEIVSDTRALEGTLLSIYARTIGRKEQVDLAAVDEFFQEKVTRTSKKITPNDIIKTVCSYYNVKQSHIKNPGRTSEIVLARQVIMYILREEFGIKLDEVANILRKKDHTTIMHGSEKIKRLMMKDPQFKEEVNRIISSVHSST